MNANLALRCTASQLPTITHLTLTEIRQLIEFGVFPPAKCHPAYGPSWNATKVNAWAWGLRNVPRLAAQVEFVLGYRRDDWAKSPDGGE